MTSSYHIQHVLDDFPVKLWPKLAKCEQSLKYVEIYGQKSLYFLSQVGQSGFNIQKINMKDKYVISVIISRIASHLQLLSPLTEEINCEVIKKTDKNDFEYNLKTH